MMRNVLIPAASDPQTLSLEAKQKLGRYYSKLLELELTPVVVWPEMGRSAVGHALDNAQGVLFMGGDDIDARHWGQANHPKANLDRPERDALELWLARETAARKIPCFAICRGAQVLNVALGGTLLQHIPDVCDEYHGSGIGDGQDHDHWITLIPGTAVRSIIDKDRILVNCFHHQAVGELAPSLRIAARSAAGIVEIVEGKDPSHFLVGVQSHPERMADSQLHPLFEAFGVAVRGMTLKARAT